MKDEDEAQNVSVGVRAHEALSPVNGVFGENAAMASFSRSCCVSLAAWLSALPKITAALSAFQLSHKQSKGTEKSPYLGLITVQTGEKSHISAFRVGFFVPQLLLPWFPSHLLD